MEQMTLATTTKTKTHIAEIVRYDGAGIQLPKGMTLETAADLLTRQARVENEIRPVSAEVPAFPYDGAYALTKAINEVFGFSFADNKKDFFGNNSNSDMKLIIDHQGTTVTIPWGRFQVPGIEGHIHTGAKWAGDTVIFTINGEIRGKSVPAFDLLVEKTKEYVRKESIYRGKVLNAKFTDDTYGETLPVPELRFVDVGTANRPIYSRALEEKLDMDVMSYITSSELARHFNGGTLKRGMLLNGVFGSGKTMLASWIAKVATDHGWTFIYCDKAGDFKKAHLMARAYQPAVIFVEDVENIAGHDRTKEVNDLLNVLDGADTKHLDIFSIFTTNHVEKITEAMFRPGRIDVRMSTTPPDAEAAIRLAHHYAEGNCADEDFGAAGDRLSGMIPATIKEAVARARMRASIRSGSISSPISCNDLVMAALSIENERQVEGRVTESELVKAGLAIAKTTTAQLARAISLEQEKTRSAQLVLSSATASPNGRN